MKKNILIILLVCPLLSIGQEEFSIDMQNTERANHLDTGGLIYYDLNFYPDYPEFNTDGGGLSVYSSEDGWGAVFDTNNMRWLRPEFRGLDVNGGVKLNPGLTNENSLQVVSNTSSQINLLMYVQNSAQWNIYANGNGQLRFRRTDNNPNGGNKMVIDGDNVGIGTDTPDAKLHVYGSNAGQGNVLSSIMFGRVNGPEIQAIQESSDDDVQGMAFRVKSSALHSNPNFEAVRIDRYGNVGVGTTSPDAKLAVNGTIHAKEVKVDLTGWPDYVFKEDYNLPTLEEVEKYIKEKGHLINTPSAKEVEENGIELGKMNKLLLEKIEELILYTLQQQRELEIKEKLLMAIQEKFVDQEGRLQKIEKLINQNQ